MSAGPSPSTITAVVPSGVKLVAPDVTDAPIADEALAIEALPASLRDRYAIGELLGQGGMGAVYRAHDRRLDRAVALKILFRRGASDGARALREARAQARLTHPNICRVFEVGEDAGVGHIAMELIAGEPFGVAGARMSLEEKVGVVIKAAEALHEAHRIGLVHRDVKPSNLVIEAREDGTHPPYLLDFGLAREVGAEGATASGVVAGTPAFMPPEQARGEIHALDRRTDVYALGATLFDVVAGRPPFVAETAWALLQQVLTDDAPPLRRLCPEVPRDLEAIVARCLERSPSRRYDSARALAEDLQRFLDGDPVVARRLSRGVLLLRWARKRRALVALALAALVTALAVLGLGVRERRRSTAQAELARALGEDVKEMELSLRVAFALPLHDIEVDKDRVRRRLAGIEARMLAAGPSGEGPGEYALGRGLLALQEPERALEHLTRAVAAGHADAELDYALGLALGQLGERALAETRRIENEAQKKRQIEAIRARYQTPALAHLRKALGVRLDAPAYAEGLIALHEGRPDEALAKAREAAKAQPWLHEAKLLEGDARVARGNPFRHDAAFDHARMMAELGPAADAYDEAAAIGRSDPRVHLAACDLWAQVMNAAPARAETLRPAYEKAKAACGRAITASSRDARGHLALAFLQVSFAWWITTGPTPDEPGPVLHEAMALAEDAIRRSPTDPMAHYVMAAARRAEARADSDHGLDSRASTGRAIQSYEEALRLDPSFLWAINDLAFTHTIHAENDLARGLDPEPSLTASLTLARRAQALDPTFLYARSAESIALLLRAEHLVDTGRDPAPVLAAWREAIAAASALSADWPWGTYYLGYQAWLEARHALETGGDPVPALDRGARAAAEFLQRSQATVDAGLLTGRLALTRAQHLLARGDDPTAPLTDATAAFQRASAEAPWDVSLRVLRAQAAVIGLRWAAQRGTLDEAAIEAAAAPLTPVLDRERVDPRLYQTLAELKAIEAAWLLDRGKDPEPAVRAGLDRAAHALTLHPALPSALATQAALRALRSRAPAAPRR